MTKRKLGGYSWRQTLTRAMNANRAARMCLRRMLDEQPNGQVLALLVARAASSLAENLDALQELIQYPDEYSAGRSPDLTPDQPTPNPSL